MKFLSENLIDVRINDARNLLAHYDNDKDGLLSYKEFLDIVLPKEHPDLRAFVTQRECFEINDKEFLSYETEAAMAILLALEVGVFEGAIFEKQELDRLVVSGHKVVEMIDGDENGNLNFNNIQRFLHECGLMPYDSEIINFLRRIDRDDDGVISGDELCDFLDKFTPFMDDTPLRPLSRIEVKSTKYSPLRTLTRNKYSFVSPMVNQIAKKMGQAIPNPSPVSNEVRYVHKASPSKTVVTTTSKTVVPTTQQV
jgi:Ca2+-binding EF-hand superfamily protein